MKQTLEFYGIDERLILILGPRDKQEWKRARLIQEDILDESLGLACTHADVSCGQVAGAGADARNREQASENGGSTGWWW
jgi:hypothetical protein